MSSKNVLGHGMLAVTGNMVLPSSLAFLELVRVSVQAVLTGSISLHQLVDQRYLELP